MSKPATTSKRHGLAKCYVTTKDRRTKQVRCMKTLFLSQDELLDAIRKADLQKAARAAEAA